VILTNSPKVKFASAFNFDLNSTHASMPPIGCLKPPRTIDAEMANYRLFNARYNVNGISTDPVFSLDIIILKKSFYEISPGDGNFSH
jgi:hypothetical protein